LGNMQGENLARLQNKAASVRTVGLATVGQQ
jgi:hypothetical protein